MVVVWDSVVEVIAVAAVNRYINSRVVKAGCQKFSW